MPFIEGAGLGSPILHAGTPTNGQSSKQTVTITGSPSGGTFKLRFEGFISEAISYAASQSALQTALEALSSIGAGNVSVSKTLSVYTVSFQSELGKREVSLLEVYATAFSGGTAPAVAVVETQAGITATERGAAPGAQLIDATGKKTYQNAGTALAPDWNLVGEEGVNVTVQPDDQTLEVVTDSNGDQTIQIKAGGVGSEQLSSAVNDALDATDPSAPNGEIVFGNAEGNGLTSDPAIKIVAGSFGNALSIRPYPNVSAFEGQPSIESAEIFAGLTSDAALQTGGLVRALRVAAVSDGAYGTDTEKTLDVWASKYEAGTLSEQTGIEVNVEAATGTVSDSAAIRIQSPAVTGGAIVTALIGLKIEDQTGGVSNKAIQTGAGLVDLGDDTAIDGDLSVTGDVTITGNLSAANFSTPLAEPQAPTVAVQGTSGSSVYHYQIVAKNGAGTTNAGKFSTNTDGPDLNSAGLLDTDSHGVTGFCQLTWSAVPGASSYDVYRIEGGETQGKIAESLEALTLDDTNLAGDASEPPFVNTTAPVAVYALERAVRYLTDTQIKALPSAGTELIPATLGEQYHPGFFAFVSRIVAPYFLSASVDAVIPARYYGGVDMGGIADVLHLNWTFNNRITGDAGIGADEPAPAGHALSIVVTNPAAMDVVTAISQAGTAAAGTGQKMVGGYDSNYSGAGAQLSLYVQWAGGVYTVTLAKPGHGFNETSAGSDILTFPGTLFGGTSPANDLTVTIESVDDVNEADDFTGGDPANMLTCEIAFTRVKL